jgi:hypothetical protein
MASTKAPSLDDIKAGFVFHTLDTIVGEPTYKSLELAHNQCIRNATTVDSRLGGGGHGHAGLIEFPDVYLLRTGNHFNRPAYPGDSPTYALGADPQQREATLLLWYHSTRIYQTCQRIEKILLSMLENAIDATFLTGIHDPAHGFGSRSIIDVFQYLFATYGQIGPDELLANQQKLTTPVDPNQPIAILFRQIEDCQKFAAAGNVAITPAQVLKAAETLILQTGKYTSAYREWIGLDEVAKTYQNFKTRMTREYQLQNQMTSTARDAGYHGANAAINDIDEASLASAAQDFAAASAADRAAFEQLTNTNGDLTSQVANMATQNLQLQQQMGQLQHHMMCMATTPPPAYPPQQQGGRGRGRQRQPQQQRQRQRQQQQPMQMPYGLPPPPYGNPPAYVPNQHPPYRPPPYGSPPAHGQGQQTPYRPPPQQHPPIQQAPFGQPPPGFGSPPASHGYAPRGHFQPMAKRYTNMNYCWTHGGDVDDSHTSQTCRRPNMPYHQPQATRQHMMGGSQKDLHRVSYPGFGS